MDKPTPMWKKVLGVLGVLMLVALIALAALLFWAKTAAEQWLVDGQVELPAVAEEGLQYGATHTARECVAESIRRAETCGDLDMTCQIGSGLFGQTCLDAAAPDPSLCGSVPKDATAMLNSGWAEELCVNDGYAQDGKCPAIYTQVVLAHCQTRGGAATP